MLALTVYVKGRLTLVAAHCGHGRRTPWFRRISQHTCVLRDGDVNGCRSSVAAEGSALMRAGAAQRVRPRWALFAGRGAQVAVVILLVGAAPVKAELVAVRVDSNDHTGLRSNVVVSQDDGRRTRILAPGASPLIAPNGTRVAFLAWDVIGDRVANERLELHAVTGGTPTRVVVDRCVPSAWSPDSTKLACVQRSDTSGLASLRLVDATTGGSTTLGSGYYDSQVSFSSDSTRLAFVQLPSPVTYTNRGVLRVMTLATLEAITLRTAARAPVWGPTEIAFSTVRRRGSRLTFDVARISPDGGDFRRLTRFRGTAEESGLRPVAWSANGKRLLAGAVGDDWTSFLSYAIDPIRGGMRLITRRLTPSALSRDGRYVIGQTGSAATSGLYRSTVSRVRWTGGERRVLIRHATDASSDG